MVLPQEQGKIYVVEHLDPELEEWSALEYKTIAEECQAAGARFVLSSVAPNVVLPISLREISGLEVEQRSAEVLFNDRKNRVCLLDPAAKEELSPTDSSNFDIFLFGGILGDDPPRDRTAELRNKGYAGRRLGPVQMTTDTAVRVTRMIVQDGVTIDKIPCIDKPDFQVDEHESVEMPFRYVRGADSLPVLPKGMLELIKKDSEKGFGDLL